MNKPTNFTSYYAKTIYLFNIVSPIPYKNLLILSNSLIKLYKYENYDLLLSLKKLEMVLLFCFTVKTPRQVLFILMPAYFLAHVTRILSAHYSVRGAPLIMSGLVATSVVCFAPKLNLLRKWGYVPIIVNFDVAEIMMKLY